jgi:hypothetical protein
MAFLKSNTHYGRPIELNGLDVIPISKSLRIQPKGIPVGLRWERPVGVLVKAEAGEEQVLPIEDVTRKAQIAVFLFAAAAWLFARSRMRRWFHK